MDSYISRVEVGGVEYTVKHCSATQQYEILELFFKYGLDEALYRLAMGERELVAASLFGNFSKHAATTEKRQVTEMLLGGCIKVGSKEPVKIEDFHNNMFSYISLHIEALKVNYADFMPFLQSSEEDEPETPTQDDMSPV